MKITEIIEIVKGKQLIPAVDLNGDVKGAFTGDLMSDVLASIQPEAVLITGLSNPQVIRTAMIADVRAIIFGRGKKLAVETISLAIQERIPVIVSDFGLYEISGLLREAGLPSFENIIDQTFDED